MRFLCTLTPTNAFTKFLCAISVAPRPKVGWPQNFFGSRIYVKKTCINYFLEFLLLLLILYYTVSNYYTKTYSQGGGGVKEIYPSKFVGADLDIKLFRALLASILPAWTTATGRLFDPPLPRKDGGVLGWYSTGSYRFEQSCFGISYTSQTD